MNPKKINLKEFQRLYQKGLSLRKISKIMGCSHVHLWRVAKENKIILRNKKEAQKKFLKNNPHPRKK